MIWKEAMEKKGLRVNAEKTKVMICGKGLHGPLADFRQIPMCCMSYRCRQQQHLMQWLQVVASFCYPGDMLSACGGCEITVTY